MRISSVSIKNLRCIKETNVELDPYTCFVGANGAGKSTLLCALNIFFRNAEAATDLIRLSPEDFHHQDTKLPVEITVTFTDLSAEAKVEFKEYVRQDALIVSAIATFDPLAKVAEVLQFGERLVFQDFAEFFKKLGDKAPVSELKPIYEALRADKYSSLPPWKSQEGAIKALREHEAARPDECTLLRSQDQFYGATKGAGRLDKYVQWVYIPAVKDATDEEAERRDTALGKLLARTVRKKVDFDKVVATILDQARASYEKMLSDNQPVLAELSAALTSRLQEWAHPEASLSLEWQQDSNKAVRADPPLAGVIASESNFRGKLARFGHGFQRSFLLALLQELASADTQDGPRLILGCEEPELYQHPPQARQLASVFETLAAANAQILVTTHSPYFVSGRNFESVRLVHRLPDQNCSKVEHFKHASIAAKFSDVTGDVLKGASAQLIKVHQALQPVLNEMFFTQRLILVEGLEDLAYIQTWLILTDRWELFRRAGCHIVPCSGKSEMIRPVIIAQGLGIPHVALFDSDSKQQGKPNENKHIRDNVALLRLLGGDSTAAFSDVIRWGPSYICWPENFGETVEEELRQSLGDKLFEMIKGEVCKDFDFAGDLGKASLYIGSLLTLALQEKATCPSLDQVCNWIITFGGVTIPSKVSTNIVKDLAASPSPSLMIN